MAVTLSGQLAMNFNVTGTHDLGTPSLPVSIATAMAFSSGTGSDAIDTWFGDSRTLSTTNETLDLSGSLANGIGGTAVFVEVRLIYIRNTHATGTLTVGNATAPAYAGLFPTSTYTMIVPPGGFVCWYAPKDGYGLTVTATTGDGLKIDASAAITYDIVLGGVSA